MSRRRFLARGFSLIELLIVIAIILIIAAIAMPKLTKARMFAYEMAAVRTLGTINTAQAQYFSTYGRYATTLIELGPPPGGGTASTAAAADLISGDLSLGTKSGYLFTMVGNPQGYAANANPQVYNTTGTRSFFTDQSTVIREHLGNEPASVNDPEIK
ncbi:MAG: prepilin-type N-terminal cleavage/methylation domain-containing protein [Acidobacteria bacterium]|nr:prepilin-type N-terminal cleavage/methylation domain-containing protein [Acidobacteriota bacterium]